MARCRKNGSYCEYFFESKFEDETYETADGSLKKMDQYCFYCTATPRLKKIGHKASWTGNTPKWCPEGRA